MLSRLWRRLTRELLRRTTRSGGGMVRLGSGYGGWWVPAAALKPGAVAYCVGAGEDISFDMALLDRGLEVVTFDPTPRAIAHVDRLAVPDERFRFLPVGWWDSPGEIRFYAPRNPAYVSHSAVNLQQTGDYFTAAVDTPRSLMRQLGHSQVDIVKLDIEGAERRVIRSMLEQGPLPSVLAVEFDQPQPFRGVLATIRSLRRRGYRVAHVEGWDVTLVRR